MLGIGCASPVPAEQELAVAGDRRSHERMGPIQVRSHRLGHFSREFREVEECGAEVRFGHVARGFELPGLMTFANRAMASSAKSGRLSSVSVAASTAYVVSA